MANDFEMPDKVRIPALYAEIERLTGERAGDQQRLFHYEGEIERLTAEIARLKADDTPYSEIDMNMHVEAVTKDLKAEIERLRAALNNIVTRYDTKQDGWHAEDMKEIARRALEGNSGQ